MINYATTPQSNLIGLDNVIAALKQLEQDRISSITLQVGVTNFERFVTVMQGPFPELTRLFLTSNDTLSAVLPDTFLGRFAPRLRRVTMKGIPFPDAFSNFLLTARNLVSLQLAMPETVYISPEAMAASLSAFTRLEYLSISIRFQPPASPPNRMSRHPPPPIHTDLPTLNEFSYRGGSEYLEDFVAQINTPHISSAQIYLSNQPMGFSLLTESIYRSGRLKSCNGATLFFMDHFIDVSLNMLDWDDPSFSLLLKMPFKVQNWPALFILQKFSPIFSSMTQLEIQVSRHPPDLQPDLDNLDMRWLELELFYHFTAVKSLIYPRACVHPLGRRCNCSLRKGPRMCCLLWRAFSWRVPDLCGKPLSPSFPCARPPADP
jgi:hypothetical protein